LGAAERCFVALADVPGLDPLKQQFQTRPVHFSACDIVPSAYEAPLLQALAPHAQAAAVEVQDADLCSTPVNKREQVAGQWILVHDVLGQRIQAIERQAHVDRLPVQEHAHLTFRGKTSASRDRQDDAITEIDPDVDYSRRRRWCRITR